IPFKVLKQPQVMETFQLNLFSALKIIQHVTKTGVKASEGMSIVMISSVMSEVGAKGKTLYAMTKAALVAMIKSLALEYAEKKIRFNAISPSVVNSPLSQISLYRREQSSLDHILSLHPLG